MGIFSPDIPTPPPPPPPPPAAHPQTLASADVANVAARQKARAAAAEGAGFANTKLTDPKATGLGPTAKANLLGETSS